MNTVWSYPEPKGTARLLLLALADAANDKGVCWPGVPTLAAKCAVSERQIYKLRDQLEGTYITWKTEEGRRSIYTLIDTSTPELQDRGSDTPELEDRGEPQDRGTPEPQDRGPLNSRTGEPKRTTNRTTKESESARARETWAVENWNALADRFNLPHCRKLNKKRRAGVKRRGDEIRANWQQVEDAFAVSPFLRGESGSWAGASFDFLYCRTDALDKILEGQYQDKPSTENRNGTHPGKDRRTAVERSNQLDAETVHRNSLGALALLERDQGGG